MRWGANPGVRRQPHTGSGSSAPAHRYATKSLIPRSRSVLTPCSGNPARRAYLRRQARRQDPVRVRRPRSFAAARRDSSAPVRGPASWKPLPSEQLQEVLDVRSRGDKCCSGEIREQAVANGPSKLACG